MTPRSSLRSRLADPPPLWPTFSGAVRGVALTARIGRILGIGFGLCFVTGLFSHYQYGPATWAPIPATPAWGYRLTQGVHVITGIALIPLTLVKLWSVFPKLFHWPLVTDWRNALERLSIALLVSAVLVELATGFLNVLTWYAWPWNFVQVHYWLAFVVTGSILLHLAVQWPAILRGLRTKLAARPTAAEAEPGSLRGITLPRWVPAVKPGGITRRGVFLAAGAGVGVTLLTTVGQSFSPLESVALLAPRRPSRGPAGVPINRTAVEAKISNAIAGPQVYRLVVSGPTGHLELTEAELLAMADTRRDYPLACVEGWSAAASWTGIGLFALMKRVGAAADSVVVVKSLQTEGPSRVSLVRDAHLRTSLLATHLHDERISLDHGYPLRLIAPDRAGVLNTKWISELSVQ